VRLVLGDRFALEEAAPSDLRFPNSARASALKLGGFETEAVRQMRGIVTHLADDWPPSEPFIYDAPYRLALWAGKDVALRKEALDAFVILTRRMQRAAPKDAMFREVIRRVIEMLKADHRDKDAAEMKEIMDRDL
jgi:hypothetical protein